MRYDKSVGEDAGGGRVARSTDNLRIAAHVPVHISGTCAS